MFEFAFDQLLGIGMAAMAAVLALGGFLTESAGFQSLTAGQQIIGIWELVVGALLLIAGAKLVRDEAMPRLAAVAED